MKKDKDAEKYLKLLGEKIMALRKQRGLTQVELAANLGTEHAQIGRLERGETNATIIILRRIAFELDVAIGDLVEVD
jgi:transcriptional regulator with XRE-family HTH domain